MKFIIQLILIIIAVILQISLVPKLALFGTFPNIILLIFLALLFIGRPQESLWWAGIGGILLDLASPSYFGIYTFSMLIVYVLVFYLTNRIFSNPSVFVAAVIFFVSSLMINSIFIFYVHNYAGFLIEAVYSTLIGCMIYGLMRYRTKKREEVKI
jgi:rod shape-determining protein MreD